MQYALINGIKKEAAETGLRGICPCCKTPVISKCGNVRIHHWTHETKYDCDKWKEIETLWHRTWKNEFSENWREKIFFDDVNNEYHRADVCTDTSLVIEFQHSNIRTEEKTAREKFYKNMVWVVDASEYYEIFRNSIKSKVLEHYKEYRNYFYADIEKINVFPKKWLDASVPVLFDFGLHNASDYENDKLKKWLWCVFPEQYYLWDRTICGICINKETFINRVTKYNTFFANIMKPEFEQMANELIKEEERQIQEYEKQAEREAEEEQRQEWQQRKEKSKIWAADIQKLKEIIEQNKLQPLILSVNKDGKITDNKTPRIYNGCESMALGIKRTVWAGTDFPKNEVLIQIKYESEMLTALITVPNFVIDKILKGKFYYDIRIIDVFHPYEKYIISFDKYIYEKIWTIDALKQNLEFINKNFSGA